MMRVTPARVTCMTRKIRTTPGAGASSAVGARGLSATPRGDGRARASDERLGKRGPWREPNRGGDASHRVIGKAAPANDAAYCARGTSSAPLYNVLVDRTGVAWVLARNRANSSGNISGTALSEVATRASKPHARRATRVE